MGAHAGRFPGFGVLPSLPSFDFRWLFEHDRVGEIVLLVLVFGLIGLAIWVSAHVAEFRERVGQAFTIVHTPLRWFRPSRCGSSRDWALRLTTIWFMLDAFGIDQSAPQRAARAGLAEPRHPPAGQPRRRRHRAGVPRLHAAGRRAATALLAFSVGMRLTLTAVNVVLGFTAILLTLRTLRIRSLPRPAEGADAAG